MARELSIPITTLNYHITNFKGEGLINDRLELTPKGMRLWKMLWENKALSNKFREHNIQVKFNVVKCPLGFPSCFSDKIYTPLVNGRFSGIKTKFDDVAVMFYSKKKIVCTLPDVYGDSIEDCISGIEKFCIDIKQKLESEFKGIVIDKYEMAKITHIHSARMNSAIIEGVAEREGNFKIGDVEIDSSKGRAEIETTNPHNSLEKIEEIDDLLERPIKQEDKTEK